ncbi:MAG: branched-chain amino acid ABC transporter permease [Caldilineales bacterium]|nr:branched-chain amino acid ABC transporter permease [Caldilineales bacterium]
MSAKPQISQPARPNWIRRHAAFIITAIFLAILPFLVGLLNGQSFGDLIANESGQSKFIQGLMIEIFILAIYAISYDLILGITGILSFGHAMFFAVGAYATGILLKSLGWSLLPTMAAVVVLGIIQALVFGIILARVSGITFALVTLGLAYVFDILIKTRELGEWTGGDVGLQGIPRPELLNPNNERLLFYYVMLAFAIVVYLLYRRFVDSPTGRVWLATRENENRAQMLGFNTIIFKIIALTIASVTAALAGMTYTLFQPIVSPEIASLGFTVEGLLMVLIGGIGTLSGPMLGAAAFKLMDFYFNRWFGENASFIIGAIYVAIVLFLPYGIVGTWRAKHLNMRKGWDELVERLRRAGK